MNTSPFHPGDKVVGYCRYSEGDQQGLKNTSVDEQETAIRAFCEQNDLVLVQVFADPFASGRSVAKRDHYLEMLSFLLHGKKKPDIAGVVLWDYERYGRNYDQATLDAARLRMAGYKIYSLQQPIVDTSPFAKVMEAMFMASAQNQSDMISADVRRALQSNFTKHKVIPRTNIPEGWTAVPVDMGTYSNGKPRTGYKAEPDPDLAPRIREAIDRRMKGATMDEMRMIIGGPFAIRREKIRLLMLKPLLYGQMTFGGTTMDNYCEPIIDKETYDRLQLYNKTAPREHVKPQGNYSKNRPLLSGLLYCGICGKKAFLDRRKAKGHVYNTYYCNDYHVGYRQEIIESLVLEKAVELLSDEQYNKDVQSITEALRTPFEAKPDNLSLQTEIAKIDRKIARISSAIEDSDESPVTLVKRLAELEKQRSDLISQTAQDDPGTEARILSESNRMRLHILNVLKNEKSTTDDRRNALSLFIHSIVLYREGKVLIRHTLPGMVAGDSRGDVSAPLRGKVGNLQLLESVYFVT